MRESLDSYSELSSARLRPHPSAHRARKLRLDRLLLHPALQFPRPVREWVNQPPFRTLDLHVHDFLVG
jgi:hypothetical protein